MNFDYRKLHFFLTALLITVGAARGEGEAITPDRWKADTPIVELLFFLGEKRPSHAVSVSDPEQIKTGEMLVKSGRATLPTGEQTARISRYFVCTDCHNTVREDRDLSSISDPEARLTYAIEKGIPLLQGTTFAGIVNRESWYNDDFAKKYRNGPFDLSARAARGNLKKAIALCCRRCSQGREPEPWEMEAFLAYFQSLRWKVKDLDITGETLAEWKRRAVQGKENKRLISEIKANYALKAPATFGEMPETAKTGLPVGNRKPDNTIGKQVFTQSCLHCHDPAEGAASTYFRDGKKSRTTLARRFLTVSKKSAYAHIRLGTHPVDGNRLYMPNYTEERLSNHQIESLRAWLEQSREP